MLDLLPPLVEPFLPTVDPAPAAPATSPTGGPPAAEAANPFSGMLQSVTDVVHAFGQEGLGVLADPSGAMDRQAAQRELAGRFQVVGDDFVGPRLPNQVTQAEYQNIAHTYSDVRLDRTDLHIDPSALHDPTAQANYRAGALDDVASLLQTDSGRQMVDHLAHNTGGSQVDASGHPVHHQTTMVPLLNADGTLDTTNGYSAANDPSHQTDGVGSDATIRYNPGVNVMPAGGATDAWLPFRSDVLLMHEMNHSMNQTAGTMDGSLVQAGDGVPGDAGWVNPLHRWEHQAAGLGTHAGDPLTENRYRDERRLIGTSAQTGARDGDATMPHRDTYGYHAPPAPAPGGGVAPPPAMLQDPHGGHDGD